MVETAASPGPTDLGRFDLGKISELAIGAVKFVRTPRSPPKNSLILLRTEAGVRAYWNICQHLPIPLDSGIAEFPQNTLDLVCLGHGARFTKDEGLCYSGPCRGRWLEPVRLELDEANDRIYAQIT